MAKALGKGLEALIKNHNTEESNRYLLGQIPISKISPNTNQPRQYFNNKHMEELKKSIKGRGVLQPITVRELSNEQYIIIAGERRYRASKALGLKWIPAYAVKINNESEMMEYALIENIQRVDLNPIEEAEGYAILRGKYNLSQQNIADKVAKSRSEISNKLRLLKLPPIIKDSLRIQEISYGHARALITIRESKKMISLYYTIIKKKYSVRKTEFLAKQYLLDSGKKKNILHHSINRKKFISILENSLNTKVDIKLNKNYRGTISFPFSSLADFKKLIKKLGNK